MPNLKNDMSSVYLRSTVQLRDLNSIASMVDLAFCLHWGIRQLQLEGHSLPKSININDLEERRHALEWVVSEEHWDNITLDT